MDRRGFLGLAAGVLAFPAKLLSTEVRDSAGAIVDDQSKLIPAKLGVETDEGVVWQPCSINIPGSVDSTWKFDKTMHVRQGRLHVPSLNWESKFDIHPVTVGRGDILTVRYTVQIG